MEINSRNSVSFTSFNNPIKPFKVMTRHGEVCFREVNYRFRPHNGFYRKLATFFIDIFADTSSHPFWKSLRKPLSNKPVYEEYINDDMKKYKLSLSNNDTTILIGRDKKKNIVAALYSKQLKESMILRDFETLYLDSIAVDKNYRGDNLGKIMLQKLCESSKNKFTDIFLVAYKEAMGFYQKNGFSFLNIFRPEEQFVISEMAKVRIDYPEYSEFMSKKLNDFEPANWCYRIQRRSFWK